MSRIVREVVIVPIEGVDLVGTFHPPSPEAPRADVGFLFVNFGYVPRDGHGGLAAKACDALAKRGFPAFRFDLPALGDTEGELPEQAQLFFDKVTGGGFAQPTVLLEQELRRRYGLRGVVLGGLCGASVTATYVADRDPSGICGLALLEPEFFLAESAKSEPAKEETSPPAVPRRRLRDRVGRVAGRSLGRAAERLQLRRIGTKVFNYWGWMRLLTLENRYGKYVPLPRKLILDLVLQKDKLPAATNVPLVASWRRVVERRVPTLVITADGKLREVFFDRINGVVLARMKAENVHHVRLKGTNHIFTTGGAIEAVSRAVADWTTRTFSAA